MSKEIGSHINEERQGRVLTDILAKFPEERVRYVQAQCEAITASYAGLENDVLALLLNASTKQRFDEYHQRLVHFYAASTRYVPVDLRKEPLLPSMQCFTQFIAQCHYEINAYTAPSSV